MASEVDELIDLLINDDVQRDVKLKGWEYILGITASEDGINTLLSQKFLSFVTSCLKDNLNVSPHHVLIYKSVINLSSRKEASLKLLSHAENLIPTLLDSLCNSPAENIEPICYILNNLSSHGVFWDEDRFANVPSNQLGLLTKQFISSEITLREKYRFLALVFANITKHSVGRRYFLQNNYYLNELFIVCANPAESVIRRLGIALVLRNCCFETDCHKQLLEELNILPNLLLPLMGPEDYDEEEMEKFPIDCQYLESDKCREEHPMIRRTLVQALCLLCYTEYGWNYLKEKGVFYITKALHNWEKGETVVEAVETLLLFLLVENYTAPDKKKEDLMMENVVPSETDIVKDLPDFII